MAIRSHIRWAVQAHKAWIFFNSLPTCFFNSIDFYYFWLLKARSLAFNISLKESNYGTITIRVAIPWLFNITTFINCGRYAWAGRLACDQTAAIWGLEIDRYGGHWNWGHRKQTADRRQWGWTWQSLYERYVRRIMVTDEILSIATRTAVPYYQLDYGIDPMLLKVTTFRRTRRFYFGIWWSRRSLYHKVEVLKCDTDDYIDCLIVRCGRTVDGAIRTYLHALYLRRAK